MWRAGLASCAIAGQSSGDFIAPGCRIGKRLLDGGAAWYWTCGVTLGNVSCRFGIGQPGHY